MEHESVARWLAKRIFLQRNIINNSWTITEQCLQLLIYMFAVHNCPAFCSFIGFDMMRGIQITALLISLLVIRIVSGVSFIKLVSPLILCLVINRVTIPTAPIVALILLLVLILTIADVLSNVNMDFSQHSFTSQTLNFTKVVHPLVLFYGILTTKVWKNPYSLLVSGVLFTILVFLKNASMMRNSNFKQMLVRLYLLLACDHFTMFAASMLTLPVAFQWLAPPIVSQFLYECLKLLKKQIKLDELYSQEQYFKLTFKILAFITGKESDSKFVAAIDDFIGQSLRYSLGQCQQNQIIYRKLVDILDRRNSFQNELLKANIFLLNRYQLLSCKKMIESLKRRVGKSLFRWILIWRLEELLFESFERTNAQISFQYYESYFKCDEFRSMLVRSATHTIHLMEYSKNQDIIIEKLRKMGDRAVQYQDDIQTQYEQIQQKCTTINLLYAHYLFEIKNNRAQSRKILENLAFNEDFEIDLGINDKVFVEFDLEDEPLKILKIGHNSSILLGYERQQLQGQNHEILLPDCYKKKHREYVQAEVQEDNINNLHLYKKKTLVKTKNNLYKECDLGFKMNYTIAGKFTLNGFFHIRNNPNFIWEDFMLINDKDQIVECGENMTDFQPTATKVHTLDDLLQSEMGQNNYKILQTRGYQKLISFIMGETCNQQIKFFVKKNPEGPQKTDGLTAVRLYPYLSSMEIQKEEPALIQIYNKEVKKIHDSIYSKQYFVLLILILIFLCGVLGLEFQSYSLASQKQVAQNNLLNKTGDLIFWYTNATDLEIGLNYLDFGGQLTYSNNFTNVSIISTTLDLHFVNERLRSLSKASYSIPSLINGSITYTVDTFEMIMKLVSNAYIISKFNNTDPFLQKLMIQNVRLLINTFNYEVLPEYQRQFLIESKAIGKDFQLLNIILLICLGIGLLLSYLLLLRGQYIYRNNQLEALSLFCNGHFQEQTIDKAKQFIGKVTKEQIKMNPVMSLLANTKNSKLRKEETSFAPDFTVNDKQISKSEMSMRELSGRNLMEDSGLGKSYFSKQVKSKITQETSTSKKIVVRVGKHNKKLFVVPLIITIVIVLIMTVNLIRNQNMMDLDEKKSAENIVTFFQQSYEFSRGVNKFFNFLNLRLAGTTTNSSRFMSNPSALIAIQGNVNFQEISFNEFKEFEAGLVQLQYSYMCTYMPCEARFYSEINIIYTATIQKLLKSMNSLIISYSVMNVNQLQTNLTSNTTQFTLNLVLYSQKMIRGCVEAIMNTYVFNYMQYSVNLIFNKRILIVLAIAITFIGILLFLILVVKVIIAKRKLQRLINVFRVENDGEINEYQFDEIARPMVEVAKVMMSE